MRIETERLVIRSFLESDAHAYAAIAADPDVMKHTGEGLPQSFDSSRDYVLRCIRSYETRGYSRYAVCLKAENGLPIGFCGFMDDNGELEFGWRYGKPYWGRGWQSVAGPFRVARGGLRVSGAKRGAERWFHIVTDERQSLWPEPPCAQRVTAASGHLPRCPSSIDWGDIDFVVAPRIRPNGARNAIPAGSCHGLLRHGSGEGRARLRSSDSPFSDRLPLRIREYRFDPSHRKTGDGTRRAGHLERQTAL